MNEFSYKYDKSLNKILVWWNMPYHTIYEIYYLNMNGTFFKEVTNEITYKEYKNCPDIKLVCKLKVR